MNINLGLITIGNGNWKEMLKQMWSSLEINETGYRLMRANDEFEYKLTMDNINLPSWCANCDIHVQCGNLFRMVISMPVIEDYEGNDCLVDLPWYNVQIKYSEASKICADRIIQDCNYIVILLGDNLSEMEKKFRKEITEICVGYSKNFCEIGNNCRCFNYDNLVKCIESGENYCSYNPKDIVCKVG